MFDFQLLSIATADSTHLPGFLTAIAPRRAARGRSEDQLIVLLNRRGRPLSNDPELARCLEQFAQAYFKTAGTVTAAMRAAAETLSKDLLALSRRNPSPESSAGYLLNVAVLHGSMLYLGHCGPVHSFVDHAGETQHCVDTSLDGRGFGLGQGAPLRFFQSEIAAGDGLLLAAEAPDGWASLDLARLFKEAPAQIRAVLAPLGEARPAIYIRFQPGAGKIEALSSAAPSAAAPRPAPAAQPAMTEKPVVAAAQPTEVLSPAASAPEPAHTAQPAARPAPSPAPAGDTPPWEDEAIDAAPAARVELPPRIEEPRPVFQATRPPAAPAATAQARTPEQVKPRASQTKPSNVPLLRTLSQWLHGGQRMQSATSAALQRFFQRLLPGQSDQPYSLSPITMGFIAVAVPLVVVTLALAVYFERGRDKIFDGYFAQAVQSAALTQNTTDPAIIRSAWAEALYWLDKAEANHTTSDSQALRGQAQQALDTLDNIVRLDYQPAIVGGLAQGVNVTQIVATSSEIYLLNGAQGRVQRAILTGRGFEVDPNFLCEPGPSGSYVIGQLVDIAAMPKGNEFGATVMAIDGSGNLMFCGPGVSATSIPLGAPDTNWGKIQAITYINNTLYVLDPPNNAIWVYDGMDAFRDRPRMFFGAQIPTMNQAIDLTANGDDVFVLHADGHMTLCTTSYGSQSDPHCTDPAPLTDPRPVREKNAAILPDTQFAQIQYTQPPDPSLYMLNPSDGSIYHFSLRMNLQRLLKSFPSTANPFPDQAATAFAVAPNRMIFIAFANQLFYAIAP
ncbi:MAG TPA: hypothetical protein VHO48_04600 [Anaerolineaceae bacterium]|nr:hypothetical protein [Anaerolineaceae bacterium]